MFVGTKHTEWPWMRNNQQEKKSFSSRHVRCAPAWPLTTRTCKPAKSGGNTKSWWCLFECRACAVCDSFLVERRGSARESVQGEEEGNERQRGSAGRHSRAEAHAQQEAALAALRTVLGLLCIPEAAVRSEAAPSQARERLQHRVVGKQPQQETPQPDAIDFFTSQLAQARDELLATVCEPPLTLPLLCSYLQTHCCCCGHNTTEV